MHPDTSPVNRRRRSSFGPDFDPTARIRELEEALAHSQQVAAAAERRAMLLAARIRETFQLVAWGAGRRVQALAAEMRGAGD